MDDLTEDFDSEVRARGENAQIYKVWPNIGQIVPEIYWTAGGGSKVRTIKSYTGYCRSRKLKQTRPDTKKESTKQFLHNERIRVKNYSFKNYY